MNKIVLLDSNSLLHRAFYAIPANLTDSQGRFTNAVYGFTNMLLKIISDLNPTHIAAAFDLKEKTFRHKKCDYYKATRKPMPTELVPQVDMIKSMLRAMKIEIVSLVGFEADDIIGTLSAKFEKGNEVIIVTGDRDSLQLVSDNTHVYLTKRGITDIVDYSVSRLKEEGLEPGQVIELKALMGDSSDNIKGVEGIGEVTAKKLLNEYHDVSNLYAHIDEISGKLKEKLLNGKEMAKESAYLATIVRDVPLELTLDNLRFDKVFSSEVKNLMKEYGFNSLFGKLVFSEEKEADKKEIKTTEIKDLSELPEINGKYAVIFADDIYIANCAHEQYKLKIKQGFLDDGIDLIECLDYLWNKIGYFIVHDAKNIMRNTEKLFEEKKVFDTYLAQYLIDSQRNPDNFPALAEIYGFEKEANAANLFSIYELQEKELSENSLQKLFYDVEIPLLFILYDMERSGFCIDIPIILDFKKEFEQELKDVSEKIFELAGEKFNINSPKQLSHILYDKLGLKVLKKNKTGASSRAEVLEELEDKHPIVSLILRYRHISKLLGTYIDGLYNVADKENGKVHTVFMQGVTATGRLSSKEPNLQNIPIRNPEGMLLRKIFVPSKGNMLVTADYSQIELRLLAHFSEDPILLGAYREGKDIHSSTAAAVFNVSEGEVTSGMRRSAKAVNFGIIYGISDFGLAENLKISVPEAKKFIAKYFETYPSVKKYMEYNVEFARENGYAVTMLGRKRKIPELKSGNYNLRSFGERVAMNMPLQGTAADIIKIAMINVYNALKKGGYKAKLILQVHDELLIDTPENEVENVKILLKREMENAVNLRVPLVAEVGCGKDWYDVK